MSSEARSLFTRTTSQSPRLRETLATVAITKENSQSVFSLVLEENIMDKNYKPITSMKEVPEQLRKLRRQYLRYQQAEIIYSISHKKLFELASDAGALYRIDGTVLINRDIFDAYLERFHEPATGKGKEEMEDER